MSTTGATSAKQVAITDASFSKENVAGYQLIIGHEANRLFLALHQTASNKFTALQEIKAPSVKDIEKALTESNYYKKEFGSVLAAFATPITSLLPESIAKTEKTRELLEINHPVNDTKIYSDTIPGTGIVQLYQPGNDVVSVIKKAFPQAIVKHFSTALLTNLIAKNKNKKENTACLYLHEKHFQLIIFKAGQLVFSNWFEYSSDEDVLYYLLYTLEQLDISTEQIGLEVMGKIARTSTVFSQLEKYIKQPQLAKKPSDYTYTAPFNELEFHQWYGIFCQPANTF